MIDGAGFKVLVTDWQFGTILDSIEDVSVSGFSINANLTMNGINHLKSLKSFTVSEWDTIDEGGLTISIDGNDHSNLSEITIGSDGMSGYSKDIELKNICSWREGDEFPVNAQVQIINCNILGTLTFSDWNTNGTYNPELDEPGTLTITNTLFGEEASIDLSGLTNAFINFTWYADGGYDMPSFPTLNLPDLRTAHDVTINNHPNIESLVVSEGTTIYPNLIGLNLTGCGQLSSVSSGWPKVIAPYFQTLDLTDCISLSTVEIALLMGTMYTAYADSGHIPAGGSLLLQGILLDTAETVYQLHIQFFTDPNNMGWAVNGTEWNVIPWEGEFGEFSEPQSTLMEACTAIPSPTSYHNNSGTPFAPSEATFLDGAGTVPLSSDPNAHVFVYYFVDDTVMEYFPDGKADGYNPAENLYVFWQQAVCT
jgi:hypothetical protein